MNTIKLLLSTTLVTFLVGCELMPTRTTQAQAESRNFENASKIAKQKDNECFGAVEKNHADAITYVVNNIRVINSGNFRTKNKYELLQSTRYFEEKDKVPFFEVLDARSSCWNKSITNWWMIDARYGIRMRQLSSDNDQIRLDFIMKKINVSEYNKNLKKNYSNFLIDMNNIDSQKNNGLKSAHNKEVDRNLEAYKAEQQAAANKPVTNWGQVYMDLAKEGAKKQYDLGGTTTNCQVNGNTVNCQSY